MEAHALIQALLQRLAHQTNTGTDLSVPLTLFLRPPQRVLRVSIGMDLHAWLPHHQILLPRPALRDSIGMEAHS